ncbi:carbamoyltransferase HypF [Neptunomonas antarctica]|uniref:Carbamoyltransferase HypF n=1 Tax=Neptunomonas antarctica TaxID=619304 RepID=A0A1N7L4L6_9GAMM|nr:carbamoyltransferase HypF [Neptunomonas antarctica]SIS68630.1 Hydrogenase maturation protein, carbamoyltransferase HypF [Neptunomonas antarctica]
MAIERFCINIEGIVQGVGFRPFVYRLAQENSLHGWVANHPQGVTIEAQGEALLIRDFLQALRTNKPQRAEIHTLNSRATALSDDSCFVIRESIQSEAASDNKSLKKASPEKDESSAPLISVPPDTAPCQVCIDEMFDPANRRYHYPFSNCTNCGPRFSIIESLPYDRKNTTMQPFALCNSCQQEYTNPLDRRFHAEPTACPDCGPQLQLTDVKGDMIANNTDALQQTANAILNGQIVAVKAVGGFQLLVDATNPHAVERLRQRKNRPEKPFALICADIKSVQQHCIVSEIEKVLLLSPQRPIVLLAKNEANQNEIAISVAPGNNDLGIMLPASPLHYLLMALLQRPIVATSGNIVGEPICISNTQALARLATVADLFLMHNRAIARPLDDSVVRVMNGVPVMLRRSRGYVPLPLSLSLPESLESVSLSPLPDLLAVGGQMKSCVAISHHNHVYLSQHLGDLDNRHTQQAFEDAISDLSHICGIKPQTIIHDLHPNYVSTRWAQSSGKKCLAVPHHIAHFFSCMAEHHHLGRAVGVSWDGSGFAHDGILRGGEFFCWDGHADIKHVASLRTFPLPGGEQAIREPRRQAAGLLYALLGDDFFTESPVLRQQFSTSERYNLQRMLSRQLNSPVCSSVGRLFDAVAALSGITTHNHFEGQAAMALEACAYDSKASWHFPFEIINKQDSLHPTQIIDWGPMIRALLDCQKTKMPREDIAAAFHNTLAQIILTITQPFDGYPVFLSGGVFQNKRLTETVTLLLRQQGQQVYHHEAVPANDGGLALGQIYYARCLENPSCA